MNADEVVVSVGNLADRWRTERVDRLQRRSLDRQDFDDLADTGYLRLAVPRELGGAWESPAASTRPLVECLGRLAAADPSPALVAAMHPSVLAFWLASPDPDQPAWERQRTAVFETAADGAQWGTVTSEPGSGGDILRTRTQAVPAADDVVVADIPGERFTLTGDKHFGSGTGVCSYMLTTGVVDDQPSAFFLDTRPLTTDGEVPGFTVVAEWDGVGMAATQSHAARLEACGAVRFAWDGELDALTLAAAPVSLCLFSAVVLGIVDEAVAHAQERLEPRQDSLRSYEQTEWAQARTEHWLAQQALEGMLRAVEHGDALAATTAGLRGKTAIAQLAEQALLRITRVVGGGSFSRRSPLASWFEDVRALGFLRPPWGLAFDGVFLGSFAD